jgi:phage tail sheath protein FI
LRAKVTFVSGKKFILDLYRIVSTGYSLINTYSYSLIREKDNFGKSLYIFDVFDENIYVTPKVNTTFAYTNYNLSGLTADFAGGYRGTSPTTGDYTTAWNTFQARSKYPAKIFMDCNGNSASTINTIIQTYQPYGHGISVVPMGNDATEAVTYRQGLGLDSSNVSLYTNWARIRDDYNDSFAWISDAGSIGKKYAYMQDVYDAEAPAGPDEKRQFSHGGQLNSWTYIEVEQSYTDADLQALDEAQINPVIKDETYGRMIYGNKTMQAALSSTSFIGTRRLYNNIIKAIITQVLPLQQFKINDTAHQNKAKLLCNNYLEPIQSLGYLNDFYVVCDDTNNTPITLNEHKFIMTTYLQATPDSEFIELNAVFVGNNVTISQLINGQ